MTSALTNQRRVFKLCLTQTERVSDDVTRKIGPLDFNCNEIINLSSNISSLSAIDKGLLGVPEFVL